MGVILVWVGVFWGGVEAPAYAGVTFLCWGDVSLVGWRFCAGVTFLRWGNVPAEARHSSGGWNLREAPAYAGVTFLCWGDVPLVG